MSFGPLAVVNNSTHKHVSVWTHLMSLEGAPMRKLMGDMVTLYSLSEEPSEWFANGCTIWYSASSVWGFDSLHVLPSTCYCLPFWLSCSSDMKYISLCLWFTLMALDVSSSLCAFGHLSLLWGITNLLIHSCWWAFAYFTVFDYSECDECRFMFLSDILLGLRCSVNRVVCVEIK